MVSWRQTQRVLQVAVIPLAEEAPQVVVAPAAVAIPQAAEIPVEVVTTTTSPTIKPLGLGAYRPTPILPPVISTKRSALCHLD